jgi:hypothetical protein
MLTTHPLPEIRKHDWSNARGIMEIRYSPVGIEVNYPPMIPAVRDLICSRAVLSVGLALIVVTMSSQTNPPVALSGAWEGQMLLAGNWRFMEAQFANGENIAATKVDLPQERREFRDFIVQGNRLQWTLVRGQGRIRFDGVLNRDVIRGGVEQNSVRGEFQLVKIDRKSPSRDAQLDGHISGAWRRNCIHRTLRLWRWCRQACPYGCRTRVLGYVAADGFRFVPFRAGPVRSIPCGFAG